uniref:Uncharacterized protein n=1 Tax=Caenorhabditis japonica TaxID=281687 RepID=A0A8R1EKH3_CAEJA
MNTRAALKRRAQEDAPKARKVRRSANQPRELADSQTLRVATMKSFKSTDMFYECLAIRIRHLPSYDEKHRDQVVPVLSMADKEEILDQLQNTDINAFYCHEDVLFGASSLPLSSLATKVMGKMIRKEHTEHLRSK